VYSVYCSKTGWPVLTRTSLCSGLRPGLRPPPFCSWQRVKTGAFNRSATSPANNPYRRLRKPVSRRARIPKIGPAGQP